MSAIVIDCETSGVFDFKRSADAEGQPRLAQFAMILIDEEGIIEGEHSFFIIPDGWAMQPEATEKNGLTDDFLRTHGVPVRDALEAYSQAILSGRHVIAFNAQFDCKQMRAELRRADMPDLFEETHNVCVMRKANGVILKDGGKKGWPSLERCRQVLGLSNDGAHGAIKDARDALDVWLYLKSQGVDLTPEVHHHAHVEEIRANG